MSDLDVLLQQLITGLSNGMIIALIALGYTMVYGIIELINFAHGDLFMLGSFMALTLVGFFGIDTAGPNIGMVIIVTILSAVFCAMLNWLIERLAYRPLRNGSRLAPLVSAIGVSFVLLNIGLFWGGLPMKVFNQGNAAAAPKSFPNLVSSTNLLSTEYVQFSTKDLLVFIITITLVISLTFLIKYTKLGKAMRGVAQNPTAAGLMGINIDRIISLTFILGGALAGAASVVYAIYNNTIYFQMGYRVGIDAFTAAVLGGIGNLPGAFVGGLLIGLIRSLSDQYIASQWTNTIVFTVLISVLVFRPSGILGRIGKEKV